jgi:hypothetical protein
MPCSKILLLNARRASLKKAAFWARYLCDFADRLYDRSGDNHENSRHHKKTPKSITIRSEAPKKAQDSTGDNQNSSTSTQDVSRKGWRCFFKLWIVVFDWDSSSIHFDQWKHLKMTCKIEIASTASGSLMCACSNEGAKHIKFLSHTSAMFVCLYYTMRKPMVSQFYIIRIHMCNLSLLLCNPVT